MQSSDKENYPSPDSVQKLLDRINPGSVLKNILPVEGSNSHYSHIVEARGPNGQTTRIVVKRYAIFRDDQRRENASREYKALQFASENNIPVPKPIYLDETGSLLGSPGIVTSYINGKPDFLPENPENWATRMAETLAKIHSISYKASKMDFILDANKEATWFMRENKPPEFTRAYSQGMAVWKAAQNLLPEIRTGTPVFVHQDYWPGNILWNDENIVAVVDWEEAGYGDPAIDAAYARMEISTMGYFSAADTFLRVYESITRKKLANLLYWELAAIARPMSNPAIWFILESPRKERFSDYVTGVLKRISDYYDFHS